MGYPAVIEVDGKRMSCGGANNDICTNFVSTANAHRVSVTCERDSIVFLSVCWSVTQSVTAVTDGGWVCNVEKVLIRDPGPTFCEQM